MDDEERQNEKHENEALKSAKEIVKKKNKDTAKKIVWNAVKAAIIPMLIMFAKIMAIVVLVCFVVTMFESILDEGDSEETPIDEVYNPVVPEQAGGTDITLSNWQLDINQINVFIDSYDSTNEELKGQMKNKATEIKTWQDTYGYSAGFLITVAFEENISDFDAFLKEMDEQAKTWKEKGYKTVQEIAKDYKGEETANEWGNNITKNMQETASKSGIITPGEQSFLGDGYDTIYISKSGRKYINYTQYTRGAITCSYADYVFWIWNGDNLNIYHNGCGLTSVAIILSGYRNLGLNPLQLTKACAQNGERFISPDNFSPVPVLNKYGVTAVRYDKGSTEYTESEKNQFILSHLRTTGNPVMVEVLGSANGGQSRFTSSLHWIVLLDIDDTTNTVYVSNPSKEKSYPSGGWLDIDYVLTSCVDTIRITN